MALTSVQVCFPHLVSLDTSSILGQHEQHYLRRFSLGQAAGHTQLPGAALLWEVYLDSDIASGICPFKHTHPWQTQSITMIQQQTKSQLLTSSGDKLPLGNQLLACRNSVFVFLFLCPSYDADVVVGIRLTQVLSPFLFVDSPCNNRVLLTTSQNPCNGSKSFPGENMHLEFHSAQKFRAA